jgi:enoyl-CoA hydratase
LLGAPIGAERALQLGIVSRVVPAAELEAATFAMAEQLANAAPQAVRGILDAVLIGGEATIDVGLDYETQGFAIAFSTEDMKEGTSAFLDKRKPHFVGR